MWISTWSSNNKTGLQPVLRPMEQILGFFQKGLKNYQKGRMLKQPALISLVLHLSVLLSNCRTYNMFKNICNWLTIYPNRYKQKLIEINQNYSLHFFLFCLDLLCVIGAQLNWISTAQNCTYTFRTHATCVLLIGQKTGVGVQKQCIIPSERLLRKTDMQKMWSLKIRYSMKE